MKTEKEIVERIKLIEEVCIMAEKLNAPTGSFALMIKVLAWAVTDSKEE